MKYYLRTIFLLLCLHNLFASQIAIASFKKQDTRKIVPVSKAQFQEIKRHAAQANIIAKLGTEIFVRAYQENNPPTTDTFSPRRIPEKVLHQLSKAVYDIFDNENSAVEYDIHVITFQIDGNVFIMTDDGGMSDAQEIFRETKDLLSKGKTK